VRAQFHDLVHNYFPIRNTKTASGVKEGGVDKSVDIKCKVCYTLQMALDLKGSMSKHLSQTGDCGIGGDDI